MECKIYMKMWGQSDMVLCKQFIIVITIKEATHKSCNNYLLTLVRIRIYVILL